MNPIVFALRHPITVIVAILALVGGSYLAITRSRVDIFPDLNLPVIYVAQPYGGMDPAQMEGLITNYYEYHFLYIGGIHHVESKNIQGVALMRLFFHPGTDMSQAMAETIAYVNRSRSFMPPGTVPPFVMRFDTGSVPVGYLVFSTDNPNRTIGEMQRMALFDVRPIFASLQGVSAPPPFGGSQRTIVLKVNPRLLDSQGVSLQEVILALSSGNTISPSGNIYLDDQMPIVRINAVAPNPQELGNIPIRPGSTVCLRDIGEIKDGTDIPVGYALVNGRRTVYILVTKRADASTLSVVNAVKANMKRMQDVLPDDVKIGLEFDQSPYVTRAMWGVGTEGLLGALLTGLMVWLFLRDWRSVIVVVLNIPLALLGALVALWLTGETINLMTLGGLALAVGILVDESTVEVENIHTQMAKTGNIARAVRLGNAETAVPRLLAMLCVLAVFIPSFFMEGAARALFVPLSLAVGFSMITSYILSSTLVPVLSVWLLRHRHPAAETAPRRLSFARLRDGYAWILQCFVFARWILAGVYLLAIAGLVAWWTYGHRGVGTEIFPTVDAGQFQVRLRAPTGTRIQRTEEMTLEAINAIKDTVGADKVNLTVAYVGVVPGSYPINSVYLWMSGPEESVLRVAVKPGNGVRVEELKERLRPILQERLEQWLVRRLADDGATPEMIAERVKHVRLSFEPADIVNEVMSFGSPTPIEIAVSGQRLADNRAFAERIMAQLRGVSSLRDLQYAQALDYPTLDIDVDREKLGRSGGSIREVTDSVVAATSSSRYMVPMFWPDPNTGIGFQVQVEIPQEQITSTNDVAMLQVHPNGNSDSPPIRLRDVAAIRRGAMPGEFDRYNMRRVISMTANLHGEDLGRVGNQIGKAVQAVGEPPRGVHVDVRGQVTPMQQMFGSLSRGLFVGAIVIFLLLTAYFQSPRLAFVAVASVPAAIGGVALALLITRTTLNLQSFMGAIMAMGVAVANAILLVTFAERSRRSGKTSAAAAVDAARQRLRPILMTSCAMVAGMIPMALALGEGGEQTAPLARAVIGGLVIATLTTLILLPFVFMIVQGSASTKTPSLDPDDPESVYHGQSDDRSAAPVTACTLPRWRVGWIAGIVICMATGCNRPAAAVVNTPSQTDVPSTVVKTTKPQCQTIRRTIEQPGELLAFEQTPIYSKIPGYVKKVNKDIGDPVQTNEVLAVLWVPEMEVELKRKDALVKKAEAELEQARLLLTSAQAALQSAEAKVREAEAGRLRAKAEMDRAKSQYERLKKSTGVVTQDVLDEARLGLEAAQATVAEVEAKIKSAEANRVASAAQRDKAQADIGVAEASLQVAKSDRDHAKTLLDYAEVRSPFDGIVSRRHIDTGHFLAATGGKGDPLFVVVRTDPLRVLVDVPEADAILIDGQTQARVNVQALKGRQFSGAVKRSAWALDPRSRTLRTEIDLSNPEGLLRPGMYVHTALTIEHANVWTLPENAVARHGGHAFIWQMSDGKATRRLVQLAMSDGKVVEILKLQAPHASVEWQDVTGNEAVILSPPTLKDGQHVKISEESNPARK